MGWLLGKEWLWLLISFLLGAILTWLWLVRKVTKRVPRATTRTERNLKVGAGAAAAGAVGAGAAAAVKGKRGKVDVEKPDVDVKKPDVKAPEVKAPEVTKPDVDIKKPDVDIRKPEVKTPDGELFDQDHEAHASGLGAGTAAAGAGVVGAGAGFAAGRHKASDSDVDDKLHPIEVEDAEVEKFDNDAPTASIPVVKPEADVDHEAPTAAIPVVKPDADASSTTDTKASSSYGFAGTTAAAAAGGAVGGAAVAGGRDDKAETSKVDAAAPKSDTVKADAPKADAEDPMVGRFGAGAASPKEDGSAPSGDYVIKGNADSMLFHTQDSPRYQATKAEVWFKDESAAETAGFAHWDRNKRRGAGGTASSSASSSTGGGTTAAAGAVGAAGAAGAGAAAVKGSDEDDTIDTPTLFASGADSASSGKDPLTEKYGAGAASPKEGGAAPSSDYTIKGNADSLLYHSEKSPSYRATIAEVWFKDEAAAEAAGFKPWDHKRRNGGGSSAAGSSKAGDAAATGTAGLVDTKASTPDPLTEKYGAGAATPQEGGAAPSSDYTIKGNLDSELYHSDKSPNYRATIAEVWFKDEAAAEAAGFKPWDHKRRAAAAGSSGTTDAAGAAGAAGGASGVSGLTGSAADGGEAKSSTPDPLTEQFGAGAASPNEDGSAPSGDYTVKGNTDSMLFHTEESPSYRATKAEVWFKDEAAARTAGFRHWDHRKR
ncbi:hypothetical protein [Luteipulveratus mongoliensis]|uniref:sunset domain-containing protein n=1 Tax=Luteipulveratus mongoliensis TaxID=571913 RepID=UPI0006990FEC|nr:hypothetical protein [Luteipulveratus mongoliensis]